ncbi:DUF6907 domain-containing protein [Streptomyces sp. NPDC088732]|uniref:DUF6907 domain-containing protein n=1 Tax=Streptomyces sp. NPDC088732 TaxID=3365879 RepID=UPI0038013238
MSARTWTLETSDAGEVTFTCPDWCVIQHRSGGFIEDIAHLAAEDQFEVPTSLGRVALQTGWGRYEYGTPEHTAPFLVTEVHATVYPERLGQVEELAQALEALAVFVRDLAPRLTDLQQEAGR